MAPTISSVEMLWKLRKHGRKRGGNQRVWKANRVPLPPILLCNPRSFRNKLDDLLIQAGVCYEQHESGLLAITQTVMILLIVLWRLKDLHTYARTEIQILANRVEVSSVYPSRTAGAQTLLSETESATLIWNSFVWLWHLITSLGNSQIYLCVWFIFHLEGKRRVASQILVHSYPQNLTDVPVFILGDFYHCSLSKSLPVFLSVCSVQYNE